MLLFVVTLLQMRESEASNQVLLQVRFAEINRSAAKDWASQLTGNNTDELSLQAQIAALPVRTSKGI